AFALPAVHLHQLVLRIVRKCLAVGSGYVSVLNVARGHLKVFLPQNGTRGVAGVYVDLDGFAFVGIRPSLGIVFVAKSALVVAHLLFGILVDVGQRGKVIGEIYTGI